MRVRFHVDAQAELEAASDGFTQDSEAVGEAFEVEAWRAVESIREFPESGHPSIRGTRRKLLRRYRYAIHYVIRPDQITIYAVAHFRQEWGYWLHRMEDE